MFCSTIKIEREIDENNSKFTKLQYCFLQTLLCIDILKKKCPTKKKCIFLSQNHKIYYNAKIKCHTIFSFQLFLFHNISIFCKGSKKTKPSNWNSTVILFLHICKINAFPEKSFGAVFQFCLKDIGTF